MADLKSAESRMDAIENRIEQALNFIGSSNLTASNSSEVQAAVVAYQKQILDKLKDIRTQLNEEVGDIAKVREERDRAVTENAQLKKDVERLNYRVKHLIKALNEEEAKNSSKQ